MSRQPKLTVTLAAARRVTSTLTLTLFLVIFVNGNGIEVWPKRTFKEACAKHAEALKPKKVIAIGFEVDDKFWRFLMDEVECGEDNDGRH